MQDTTTNPISSDGALCPIFYPIAQIDGEYGLKQQGQSFVFSRNQLKTRKVGQTLKAPEPDELFFFYERAILAKIRQLLAHQEIEKPFLLADEIFEIARQEKIRQNLIQSYRLWWRSVQHWSIYLMVGHTSEMTITSLVQFKQFIDQASSKILNRTINQLIRLKIQEKYQYDEKKTALAFKLLEKMNYQEPEMWLIGTQVLRQLVQTSPKLGACLLLDTLDDTILEQPLSNKLWQNLHKLCNMASRTHQQVFVRLIEISD